MFRMLFHERKSTTNCKVKLCFVLLMSCIIKITSGGTQYFMKSTNMVVMLSLNHFTCLVEEKDFSLKTQYIQLCVKYIL